MALGKIILADDDIHLTKSLQRVLQSEDYEVEICNNASRLNDLIARYTPDLIFLDIYYGEYNGIELLKNIKNDYPDVPIIMITAYSEISIAVEAMREGAEDFIVKPFDVGHMLVIVERAMQRAKLLKKVNILQEELDEQRSKIGIIGKSKALQNILKTADRLASSDNTTVLLEGESGTGKELIARYIYQRSQRCEKPFITLNCAAIPKDLAESEFFGYERGAFTGAVEKMKKGKFELANGGTIFLDEIGELSVDMQVKLLRLLEEKRFYRLGGTIEITVDVRILAATNRQLAREVESGRFREDLYYRLNVASIKIPSLAERREDIAPLVYSFIKEFSEKFNRPIPEISEEALEHLEGLVWRGNVRELRNTIERVVLLNDAAQLTLNHFSFLFGGKDTQIVNRSMNGNGFLLQIPKEGIQMKEIVRDLIIKTLTITKGNQVQAAKVLGLSRSKLRYRMEQLGIKPEQRSYTVIQ
jgi:two-component system, NtrC family, response regulator AtoC